MTSGARGSRLGDAAFVEADRLYSLFAAMIQTRGRQGALLTAVRP
ncbi:MAG: hypothetical protein ABR564_00030 [Candidatus Dormibacteria bacterium]